MSIREALGPGGVVQVTIDATTTPRTYTLPRNFATVQVIRVRRSDSTSGQVATVAVTSGGVIDGVTNATKIVAPDTSTDFECVDTNSWQTYGPAATDTAYGPPLTAATTYTYNADQTVASETTAGVTKTYTYNTDGTVATETVGGVTRTYTYNTDGTIASVA